MMIAIAKAVMFCYGAVLVAILVSRLLGDEDALARARYWIGLPPKV